MTAAWDWDAQAVRAWVSEALGADAGPPERLAGGLLNVVWRVPLGDRSVIAKVAPPFVAALPDVPLDPGRQRVEAAALAAFADGGPLAPLASEAVRPPAALHHDPERSVLLMEDVGDLPGLGAALVAGTVDPEAVGERLGRFLGRLHAVSVTDGLSAAFENPSAQATRLAVQYRAVGPALAEAGVPDAEALGAEAVGLGERLLQPGRCLIHGDLWPPSVLVRPDGGLRLIDWELAHVGAPGQDLGHLGAHLWMLRHRGAEEAAAACWRAVRSGYAEARGRGLSRADASEAVRHAGCEVAVRALGPFRAGTVYEELKPSHPALQEAVRFGAEALRAPERCFWFAPLGLRG